MAMPNYPLRGECTAQVETPHHETAFAAETRRLPLAATTRPPIGSPRRCIRAIAAIIAGRRHRVGLFGAAANGWYNQAMARNRHRGIAPALPVFLLSAIIGLASSSMAVAQQFPFGTQHQTYRPGT